MKINYSDVEEAVNELIDSNPGKLDRIEFVVGMSRGGLIPAAMIATKLNKPLVAIYIDKQDNIYLDRTEWLNGSEILFVDDICRSGLTLQKSIDKIHEKVEMFNLTTLTLFNPTGFEPKIVFPDITLDVPEDIQFPWDHDRSPQDSSSESPPVA